MGQRLLKAKHIAGKCRGAIVDHGLPKGRPGICPGEYVHARSLAEHFPAGPLEQA
jgi:hypothetical protein